MPRATTTHSKSYASTTDGVTSAAFGFEPATFAPTYQLIYGSPGRSLALEIAARLGLDPAVVADARRNLSAREAQLAEHLAKMDHDMRALEHEHRLAARERETLEQTGAGLRHREDALRQREETFRRRLNEELETEVRQARREIDDVIAELKARTSAIAQDATRRGVTTGDTGAVRSEARAAVDEVLKRVVEPAHESASRAGDQRAHAGGRRPSARRRPRSAGRGHEHPRSTPPTSTCAERGCAPTSAICASFRRAGNSRGNLGHSGTSGTSFSRVRVNVELAPRGATPSDLNVIGCSVDEALARAERFLDESLLTDQRTVRLIHGYGTGS